MSKLIPKGANFKLTTRVILTEAEKQEIIDSVERALDYLLGMNGQNVQLEYQEGANVDPQEELRSLASQIKQLNRCFHFIKACSLSGRLYKYERLSEIYNEARQIADETGAPFEEVKQEFMKRMDKYVNY